MERKDTHTLTTLLFSALRGLWPLHSCFCFCCLYGSFLIGSNLFFLYFTRLCVIVRTAWGFACLYDSWVSPFVPCFVPLFISSPAFDSYRERERKRSTHWFDQINHPSSATGSPRKKEMEEWVSIVVELYPLSFTPSIRSSTFHLHSVKIPIFFLNLFVERM